MEPYSTFSLASYFTQFPMHSPMAFLQIILLLKAYSKDSENVVVAIY